MLKVFKEAGPPWGARPPKVRFWAERGSFSVSGPQNRTLGLKMRPWRPPLKMIVKHNVLGRFLEAQGRKNRFWGQNGRNFRPRTKKIYVKIMFWSRMATFCSQRENVTKPYLFCFKSMCGLAKIAKGPLRGAKTAKFHKIHVIT